jgi:hypothetical protein
VRRLYSVQTIHQFNRSWRFANTSPIEVASTRMPPLRGSTALTRATTRFAWGHSCTGQGHPCRNQPHGRERQSGSLGSSVRSLLLARSLLPGLPHLRFDEANPSWLVALRTDLDLSRARGSIPAYADVGFGQPSLHAAPADESRNTRVLPFLTEAQIGVLQGCTRFMTRRPGMTRVRVGRIAATIPERLESGAPRSRRSEILGIRKSGSPNSGALRAL